MEALSKELILRKGEVHGRVETIYFGGGTPSLLSTEELQQIFETIYELFPVAKDAEITFEANPDDLTRDKLEMLHASPVNRLSIGVQSFFEEDLVLMNRAHNAEEALNSIRNAKKLGFNNISIDLIYGVPAPKHTLWQQDLQQLIRRLLQCL